VRQTCKTIETECDGPDSRDGKDGGRNKAVQAVATHVKVLQGHHLWLPKEVTHITFQIVVLHNNTSDFK
jgi:hypothetical protein